MFKPSVLQLSAAGHAIGTMFQRSKFFDICAINNVASLLNVEIPEPTRKLFVTLHCVDWADMTPLLRDSLKEEVLNVLGVSRDVLPTLPAH
jgi:hypothetical protein